MHPAYQSAGIVAPWLSSEATHANHINLSLASRHCKVLVGFRHPVTGWPLGESCRDGRNRFDGPARRIGAVDPAGDREGGNIAVAERIVMDERRR